MANKKLKAELEIETSRAKAQLAALGVSGGEGGEAGSAANRLADSLNKASRNVRDLGESSSKTSVNMKEAVRAFGGLAIGMAAQYSAKYLDEGSTARNAVEYGAGALQGASVGLMAGPIGAAVGGAIGLAKTYFDKSGESKQAVKDFETGERRYQEAKTWKAQFDSLTTVGRGDNIGEKIAALEAVLAQRKSAEGGIADSVRKFTAGGEYANANHQKESLSINRQQQQQLEASIKALKKMQEDATGEARTPTGATDALARIGADFTGGGGRGDALLQNGREQLDVLKSIERKTGGDKWL